MTATATATATERHWLAAACLDPEAAEVSPTAWRGAIQAVAGWSVATDGKTLVAVCDGGRLAEPGRGTPTDAACGVIAGTQANVYRVAEQVTGDKTFRDQDFEALYQLHDLFRCENCNLWRDSGVECRKGSSLCVECEPDAGGED